MTSAYSETSTERIPGRTWTVRITGHGGRLASVTCSTAACRMPPRSQDLAALRAFAARHAAAHAKAATVRAHAWCHCGSQHHGAHPDAVVHCEGGVVLILRHDPTLHRVWTVAEVCEPCAPLIPNATVVARAARPGSRTEKPAVKVPAPAPPRVAAGFSSPAAAPSGEDPAPRKRSRRTSQQSRRRGSGQQR